MQRKRKQARAVLLRILQIGTAVGLVVGVVAFAAKSAVPAVFTQDVTVSAEVQRVLPMIAMFMVSVGRLKSQCYKAKLVSVPHMHQVTRHSGCGMLV